MKNYSAKNLHFKILLFIVISIISLSLKKNNKLQTKALVIFANNLDSLPLFGPLQRFKDSNCTNILYKIQNERKFNISNLNLAKRLHNENFKINTEKRNKSNYKLILCDSNNIKSRHFNEYDLHVVITHEYIEGESIYIELCFESFGLKQFDGYNLYFQFDKNGKLLNKYREFFVY